MLLTSCTIENILCTSMAHISFIMFDMAAPPGDLDPTPSLREVTKSPNALIVQVA